MIILDSSALLASIHDEPGRDAVDDLVASQPCAIPITCMSEIVARLMREGMGLEAIHDVVRPLGLVLLPFDEEVSDETAALERRTRGTGTSFVDRSCIATGIVHDSIVVTADRRWADLDLREVDIHVVR